MNAKILKSYGLTEMSKHFKKTKKERTQTMFSPVAEKPKTAKSFNVYRNGKCVDTVFYYINCDAEYVRTSLINHDGYASDIVVKERT